MTFPIPELLAALSKDHLDFVDLHQHLIPLQVFRRRSESIIVDVAEKVTSNTCPCLRSSRNLAALRYKLQNYQLSYELELSNCADLLVCNRLNAQRRRTCSWLPARWRDPGRASDTALSLPLSIRVCRSSNDHSCLDG